MHVWVTHGQSHSHQTICKDVWYQNDVITIDPSSLGLLAMLLILVAVSIDNFTVYCKVRRRQWQLTSVLLPGKSHGWRSLVGCSPWGRDESDTTEQLHFHFSLSCIGDGNGNPLQCSCLENPRDTGAWWAAIYGVAQSWTQLKQLSSSSIESLDCFG